MNFVNTLRNLQATFYPEKAEVIRPSWGVACGCTMGYVPTLENIDIVRNISCVCEKIINNPTNIDYIKF